MGAPRVLVVEDDLAIRRGVADALRWQGYEPLESGDGVSGRELALGGGRGDEAPDLVLLDVVLPRGDGLDVLRSIRRERPALPVILITARGSEEQRVEGLRLGADDYVVKPFSIRELLARVEAVLRRSPERPRETDRLTLDGDVIDEIDLGRREIRFADGERCELSELEADLLRYLAAHRTRAIARDELLTRVWGVNPRHVATRSVDMTVARLRKKLRDDPARLVATVRGRGYRLDLDAEPGSEPDPDPGPSAA